MRSELVFYRNYIKASIYQPEIESSRNFAIHFDRLALLRSRPSIVTNLLKRIAILHKHPCNPARRISLEMPRRSGADITFLLDRLDERRNRYPCIPPSPSVSSRFLFSYVTHLTKDLVILAETERERERERENHFHRLCLRLRRKNSIMPILPVEREIRIHESITSFRQILRDGDSRMTFSPPSTPLDPLPPPRSTSVLEGAFTADNSYL